MITDEAKWTQLVDEWESLVPLANGRARLRVIIGGNGLYTPIVEIYFWQPTFRVTRTGKRYPLRSTSNLGKQRSSFSEAAESCGELLLTLRDKWERAKPAPKISNQLPK